MGPCYPSPSQIEEAINCDVPIATNRSILAEGETAFQNAYKAIESVVGDPPKNDTKFEISDVVDQLELKDFAGFEDSTGEAQLNIRRGWIA